MARSDAPADSSTPLAGALAQQSIDAAQRREPLLSELRRLEVQAGIATAAESWRAAWTSRPGNARLRRMLRDLYFGVEDLSQRKRLIAKQRELARFSRAWIEAELADARHRFETLEGRSAEGWWLAAIVGAALIVTGYELFGIFGAFSGAVVALFVGNGIEQESRRRRERTLADAKSELAAMQGFADENNDLFNELEEAGGTPDRTQEMVL
jgi:hypothetical protein